MLFVPIIFFTGMAVFYNNDLWFLIATGREILEKGILFENAFSLHDGMGIVVQQWLLAVELYVVWDAFGMQGLAVQTGVSCCAFYLALFCVMRQLSSCGEGRLPVVLAFVASLVTAVFYFCVRPSVLTAIILLTELLVLERYKRTGRSGILAALPVCAFAHVNIHASFWWLGFVLAVLYLMSPPRRAENFFVGHSYRKAPVLWAALCMLLASLANPYGLKGALYLAYSYAPATSMPIAELQPLRLLSPSGVVVACFAMLGVLLALRRGRGRIDFQMAILFAGTLVLACANLRNGWLFTVSSALFVSPFLAGFRFGRMRSCASARGARGVSAALSLAMGGCIAVAVALLLDEGRWRVEDSPSTPVAAVRALDDDLPPEDRESMSLFTSFNNGGFLEWAGYPVFMDARPELWSSAVTGCDKDYAAEYAAYLNGLVSADDLVRLYGFDYLVADAGSAMDEWCRQEASCEVLAEGEGYRLWKRR